LLLSITFSFAQKNKYEDEVNEIKKSWKLNDIGTCSYLEVKEIDLGSASEVFNSSFDAIKNNQKVHVIRNYENKILISMKIQVKKLGSALVYANYDGEIYIKYNQIYMDVDLINYTIENYEGIYASKPAKGNYPFTEKSVKWFAKKFVIQNSLIYNEMNTLLNSITASQRRLVDKY
jgi:hypothetical protein